MSFSVTHKLSVTGYHSGKLLVAVVSGCCDRIILIT